MLCYPLPCAERGVRFAPFPFLSLHNESGSPGTAARGAIFYLIVFCDYALKYDEITSFHVEFMGPSLFGQMVPGVSEQVVPL